MRLAFTVLLALAATAARAEWQPPTTAETTLLIAAQTSSVLDMLQTLDIKRHPGSYEMNPILGSHPSDARVLTYFATSAVIKTAAWYALPRGWRNIVPVLNLAVEIPLIAHNANVGLEIRF